MPITAQRLAQRCTPDQPQRDKAPNEREHGEDRERRDHVQRLLGREDRRIGGDVVPSVDECDGRDLKNSDSRRLSFVFAFPRRSSFPDSDDDGRHAKQGPRAWGEIARAADAAARLIATIDRHSEDLARENVATGEASVGEEADEQEQIVDIRRCEGSGRQQGKREEVHVAAELRREDRAVPASR